MTNPCAMRAIDISANENSNAIQEWFHNHSVMCQFLCALKISAYADSEGFIRNQDGDVIGVWFYAELNSVSQDRNYAADYRDEIDPNDEAIQKACLTTGSPIELTDEYLPSFTENEADFDFSMVSSHTTPPEVRKKAHFAFVNAYVTPELETARDTIASLLGRIDDLCGAGFHKLGRTPSWYIEAAAVSCGIIDYPSKDIPSKPGSDVDNVAEDDDWRFRELNRAKAVDDVPF